MVAEAKLTPNIRKIVFVSVVGVYTKLLQQIQSRHEIIFIYILVYILYVITEIPNHNCSLKVTKSDSKREATFKRVSKMRQMLSRKRIKI